MTHKLFLITEKQYLDLDKLNDQEVTTTYVVNTKDQDKVLYEFLNALKALGSMGSSRDILIGEDKYFWDGDGSDRFISLDYKDFEDDKIISYNIVMYNNGSGENLLKILEAIKEKSTNGESFNIVVAPEEEEEEKFYFDGDSGDNILQIYKKSVKDKDVISESTINEKTYIVYHGTNDKFDEFDSNKTVDGTFWFTNSLDSIKNQTHGGVGSKYIMKRKITLNNPAGWDEYDKYSLGELSSMGYDGVILPEDDKVDFIVFDKKSIQKV